MQHWSSCGLARPLIDLRRNRWCRLPKHATTAAWSSLCGRVRRNELITHCVSQRGERKTLKLRKSSQVKKSLGVLVKNFFFSFVRQRGVITDMLQIPRKLAVPVGNIGSEQKMIGADVVDCLRQLRFAGLDVDADFRFSQQLAGFL